MSLVQDAITWWVAHLRDLVPTRLRGGEVDVADTLLVDLPPLPPATAGIAVRQRGRESPLGGLKLDTAFPAALRGLLGPRSAAATLVRLPAGVLLEREVSLPLAAGRDLDRVLGYEMNRLTPFAAAEVYWARQVMRQDAAQGKLLVRLSLVPRAGLDQVMALLRAAGLEPTGLRAPVADGAIRRIGLGPAAAEAGRGLRRALAALAAACVLLGLVAAGLPLWQQAHALAAVERRIEWLRPEVAEAAVLRQRIASRTTGADVLTAETARLGSALQAIAALTAALPDDTSLTALTLRQRRVTITGQSADAAKLISLLSADPALRDVSFLSPVTRASQGADRARAELFSIRLEFGP